MIPRLHSPPARAALAAASVAAILALAACRSGPRKLENVNDELRRQNLELENQVRALEEKLRLAAAQTEHLQQRLAQTQPAVSADVQALMPTPVELRLDHYSGVVASNDGGTPDLLRLYVKPRDGKGRFVPLVGTLGIQAVLLQPHQQPTLVLERFVDPQQLDAAYRSTWMGTHYTLEIPLPAGSLPKSGDLTVKLFFTDAATGTQITHQQPLQVPQAIAAGAR